MPERTNTQNDQSWKADFKETEFKRPGVYKYVITEQKGDDPRTDYDPTEYTVTVTVTGDEATGQLKTTTEISPRSEITFNNTYYSGDPEIEIEKLETFDGEYWTGNLTGTSGDELTYQIKVTNNGEASARDVQVRDAVPAGLVYVPSSADETGGVHSAETGEITWSIEDMEPNAEKVLSFRCTLPQTDSLDQTVDGWNVFKNTAEVKYSNNPDSPEDLPWETSNEVSVTESETAHVSVSKFQGTGAMEHSTKTLTVVGGDQVTYYMDVISDGESTAKDVVVKDTVSNGLTLVSDSISIGGSSSDQKHIEWDLGDMKAGEKRSLFLRNRSGSRRDDRMEDNCDLQVSQTARERRAGCRPAH